MIQRAWQRIKSAFLTGILVGVPLGVTIWVAVATASFLEKAIHLLPEPWEPENLLGFHIPGMGILLALGTVLLLGAVAQNYLGKKIIGLYEIVLARIPLISSVYGGTKQLMDAVFSPSKGHFRQVVLVEFPRRGAWSLGFQTGEGWLETSPGVRTMSLFVPTTPNPTTGFYISVREDEVVRLDITIEEAAKLLMSAGIVVPPQVHRLAEPTRASAVRARGDEPTMEVGRDGGIVVEDP